MRVEFEFTQADMIDASKRCLARSKVARSWRRNDQIWVALLGWALVVAVFWNAPLKAAAFGLLGSVIFALIYPAFYRRWFDKRMGKYFKEKLGDNTALTCEVELTPAGYSTKQMNVEATYKWESVEEIFATEDDISIFGRDGSGVIVRSRAFTSPAQQQEFFDLANSYREAARIDKATA